MSTNLTSHSNTVSGRLRESRAIAGLTTRQIAAFVGVSPTTPSNWERGIGEPSASQVILWAIATGQTVEGLLSGIEPESAVDYRSEGWGFESLRAHDCVETVDAQFWSIVGCQGFPDTLSPFPGGVV